MSYGTKYFAQIEDFSGNTFSVQLKKKNYSGSTYEITDYSLSPLTLAYRGGRDEINNLVKPSEMTFNFYSKEGENYDDIFESNYKDFQLEVGKTFLAPSPEILTNAEFTGSNAGWTSTSSGTSFAWGWGAYVSGGSAVSYMGSFATAIPYQVWGFHSSMEGWINSLSTLAPQWSHSSDFGGSCKVQINNNTPPPHLRYNNISLPSTAFNIVIQYVGTSPTNSSNLKMDLLFRDSGNNQLSNRQFSTLFNGSVQTAVLHYSGTTLSNLATVDHAIIVVGSTDFNVNDFLWITDFGISTLGSISINRTYNLEQSFSLAPNEPVTFRYHVTASGGTNNFIYARLYDGSVLKSQHLLGSGRGHFGGTIPITDYSIDKVRIWASNTVDTIQSTIYVNTISMKQNIYYDSILYWKGFVAPEFLTRKFIAPSYFISLAATDGLQSLSKIDFPSNAITGQTPIINSIKKCLSLTDIELPIEAQLNITENSMPVTGTTLKMISSNNKRFVDIAGDGRIKYTRTNTALDYLLRPFNCQLVQSEGRYKITQRNESSSKIHTYDFPTLTPVSAVYNRTVDISDNYVIVDSDELSKVVPVKQVNLIFRNKNLGESVIENGTFNYDISGFNNGTYPNNFYLFSWVDGKMHTVTLYPPFSSNSNIPHFFTSDLFPLSAVGTGSTLTVTLNADLTNIEYSATSVSYLKPDLRIELLNAAGTSLYYFDTRMEFGPRIYSAKFGFNTTGNYRIKISVRPQYPESHYKIISVDFDNITGIPSYGDNVTFDRFYSAVNTGSTAIETIDDSIYFADGYQEDDVGVLKYGSVLTDLWKNYSGVTNQSLQKIYAYHRLLENKRFKDYLTITIKDNNSIAFNNLLKIGSKTYSITGYYCDIKNNNLSLELIEYLNDPVSMSFTETTLLSVDGTVN